MKNKIFYTGLILIYTFLSCKNNRPQEISIEKDVKNEPDVKVVQLDYNYFNYFENIKAKDDHFIIKERNVLIFDLKQNEVKLNLRKIEKNDIKSEIIDKLVNNKGLNGFPSTKKVKTKYLGEIEYPDKFIIVLNVDPTVTFENYYDIRNEVFNSINSIRNSIALKVSKKNIYELNKSSDTIDSKILEEIYKYYPMRYNEVKKVGNNI